MTSLTLPMTVTSSSTTPIDICDRDNPNEYSPWQADATLDGPPTLLILGSRKIFRPPRSSCPTNAYWLYPRATIQFNILNASALVELSRGTTSKGSEITVVNFRHVRKLRISFIIYLLACSSLKTNRECWIWSMKVNSNNLMKKD